MFKTKIVFTTLVNDNCAQGGVYLFKWAKTRSGEVTPPPLKPHYYEVIHTGLNFELEPQTVSLLENVCNRERVS